MIAYSHPHYRVHLEPHESAATVIGCERRNFFSWAHACSVLVSSGLVSNNSFRGV